jgi:hypothetical protein
MLPRFPATTRLVGCRGSGWVASIARRDRTTEVQVTHSDIEPIPTDPARLRSMLDSIVPKIALADLEKAAGRFPPRRVTADRARRSRGRSEAGHHGLKAYASASGRLGVDADSGNAPVSGPSLPPSVVGRKRRA